MCDDDCAIYTKLYFDSIIKLFVKFDIKYNRILCADKLLYKKEGNNL